MKNMKENKMYLKLYRKPENVGWLGWIENKEEYVLGFIKMNGEIQWGIPTGGKDIDDKTSNN